MVRCTDHGKIVTMVCTGAKCYERLLCPDCILKHEHSHLSKIIPYLEFNKNTNLVPSLI